MNIEIFLSSSSYCAIAFRINLYMYIYAHIYIKYTRCNFEENLICQNTQDVCIHVICSYRCIRTSQVSTFAKLYIYIWSILFQVKLFFYGIIIRDYLYIQKALEKIEKVEIICTVKKNNCQIL